jgi:hypothetical protein
MAIWDEVGNAAAGRANEVGEVRSVCRVGRLELVMAVLFFRCAVGQSPRHERDSHQDVSADPVQRNVVVVAVRHGREGSNRGFVQFSGLEVGCERVSRPSRPFESIPWIRASENDTAVS